MKTKLLTLITAVVFVILASSTVVLAVDITYNGTTYTEINDGQDLKITVSYTAAAYEEGEQVTIMVLTGSETVLYEDPENPNVPTNVAYADQKVITGAEGSFTFILAKDFVESNSVFVKLGSTSMLEAEKATASVVTNGAVTFNDINNIVSEYVSGYDGTYATLGTHVTFTVNRALLASDIKYRVHDSTKDSWGDYKSLIPDANDLFTIPGNEVTGNIELYSEVLGEEVYAQLVTAAQYKVVIKDTQDKQIFAIFGTSPDDTYTVGGKEAYWSPKYNAHVVWISSSETLITLAEKVVVTKGDEATQIVYDGDINENGKTTAADATNLNDCLRGTRKLPVTDMQLFKMDINSDMQVTTQDIIRILQMAVGK